MMLKTKKGRLTVKDYEQQYKIEKQFPGVDPKEMSRIDVFEGKAGPLSPKKLVESVWVHREQADKKYQEISKKYEGQDTHMGLVPGAGKAASQTRELTYKEW